MLAGTPDVRHLIEQVRVLGRIVSRCVVAAVVASVTAAAFVATSHTGVAGKGTLTKTGGTSYAYSVQFNQAVSGLQIQFKSGVKITSFTAPAGFQCSDAYTMGVSTVKQYNHLDCPFGHAAANQVLKGTIKLGAPLARGAGASLYEGIGKLVGPFRMTGP